MEAKIAGFVPGVDIKDGMCDILQAHFFIQVFADGDIYTVRRSAVSFFELEAALSRRFPKLGIAALPLNECDGAATYRKQTAKKKRRGKISALTSVDDLSDSQLKLTQWISCLLGIQPVFASQEMRHFITDESPGSTPNVTENGIARESSKDESPGISEYERKRKDAFGRFNESGLENIILEGLPVMKVKIQPGGSHTITLTTGVAHGEKNKEDGGVLEGNVMDGYICWAFTTLAGKTNPAKDVAFSVTFTDEKGDTTHVRPYERHQYAATNLIKGCWQYPGYGVAVLTWHNDYSKW